MIDHVIDGIYITDAASVISANRHKELIDLQIGRIFTVSAMPINDANKLPGIQYKFLFMMDVPNQDILGDNLLDNAIAYIMQAVKDGVSIIVHCEVGVSRSVTLVAAYLMKRFEWSAKKAIYFIQKKRPSACPNPAFLIQLNIFAQIGYKADPEALAASSLYRNFCADSGIVPKISGEREMLHELASTSMFNSDSLNVRNTPRARLSKQAPEVIAAQYLFRCRRCRSDLFCDTHVLYHKRGSFGTTGENSNYITNMEDRCSFEYFITPMKWMQVDEFQGKIKCPKCKEKIGHFNWGGNKCQGPNNEQCNTHVSPWFHIQRSKVDKFSMASREMASSQDVCVPTVVIS